VAKNKGSLLSDETKLRLAAMQGAAGRARPGYYGDLSSRECGNMVKYALQLAEQQLAGQRTDLT